MIARAPMMRLDWLCERPRAGVGGDPGISFSPEKTAGDRISIDNSRGDPVTSLFGFFGLMRECGGRGDSRMEIVGRIGVAARGYWE